MIGPLHRSGLLTLVVLAFGIMAPAAHAAETVPTYAGSYGEDLVWKGRVIMAGDVLIREGGSLTIRPGTRVDVIPSESTKIDPEYLSPATELLIRGRLQVQGTPEDPVRFVVPASSDEVAWAGIILDSPQAGSILSARIDSAETAIRCVNASPEIRGNHIVRCRYGIVLQEQSAPKILDNILADGEGGIFCWNGSSPYLLGNTITGHDEEAVFVDAESRPWLDRNRISGNAIGLALYPRDLPYDPVAISGNDEDIRWLGRQGSGGAP